MVRGFAAVVAGVFVGVFVILLIEMIGQTIAPLPLGMDPNDPETVRTVTSGVSVLGLLFVLLAWAIGTWIGCWLARRISESNGPAMTAMVVLLLTSSYNLSSLDNPAWFWVVGVLIFPAFGLLGARAAGKAAPASQPA